jgi:N-acetylneuraminic acid mutarotase
MMVAVLLMGTKKVPDLSAKILHFFSAGLSAAWIFARTVAFPLPLLNVGMMLVQPCLGDSGVFTNTGSLVNARYGHTATLLPNGKVLVAGGANGISHIVMAELYDPASGTWAVTGSLTIGRSAHTATLLPNGNVLVAGGSSTNPASAELYNPATGTWTSTGSLGARRYGHTATLLPNGKVLVAGGHDDGPPFGSNLTSAELYDPANGTWTATGHLANAREGHTATLLANGKVLVAGGRDNGALASAELYDPAGESWTATGNLTTARDGGTVTLLPNDKVLVTGGFGNGGFSDVLGSAELYDAASGSWTATDSLDTARQVHTATLLPNGQVLVVGGFSSDNSSIVSAEMYDVTSGSWTATGSLATARANHTATSLLNGQVLVAGGEDSGNAALASAELYRGQPIPIGLGNISTRLRVGTGDNVLIGGFIVTGTQAKRIIVRAIGPSLPLSGVLADPVLELHNSGGVLIATNDNWRSNQEADIIATTLPPSNDLESAIVATLPANNSAYTAIVHGFNNGTGIGVVEAYDLNQAVDSKLANISTRGLVQPGDNVLIGGLIVQGQSPLRVIVRAIGPSLSGPGALGDPTLELHDGNGALIAANDNWRSDHEAEINATDVPPTNDLESAIVRNLTPGNYTAIVRGVGNGTGVALVEAYGLN